MRWWSSSAEAWRAASVIGRRVMDCSSATSRSMAQRFCRRSTCGSSAPPQATTLLVTKMDGAHVHLVLAHAFDLALDEVAGVGVHVRVLDAQVRRGVGLVGDLRGGFVVAADGHLVELHGSGRRAVEGVGMVREGIAGEPEAALGVVHAAGQAATALAVSLHAEHVEGVVVGAEEAGAECGRLRAEAVLPDLAAEADDLALAVVVVGAEARLVAGELGMAEHAELEALGCDLARGLHEPPRRLRRDEEGGRQPFAAQGLREGPQRAFRLVPAARPAHVRPSATAEGRPLSEPR